MLCSLNAGTTCTTKGSQPLVSPDGAFSAIVDENVCEGEYAFLSSVTWTVDVVSQSDSTKRLAVFSFDDNGGPDTRPVLKWIAAERLVVTALTPAGVGIKKSAFATVNVLYKYVRDR